MRKPFIRLVAGCLILAILTLLGNLSTLIIKLVYNYTGFNLGNTSVSTCQIYYQVKFSYIYMILKSSFIITVIAIVLAIPLIIIFIKTFVEIKNAGESDS